ncbi:MAG: glycine cleavage system aminomethyltransferase GcvT [Candidatus Hydrogenedentes bacterium]|nr:glycine cleavage system aminomethyltransferase GcvT [Candidatus Hydrogenedentota bacterium]
MRKTPLHDEYARLGAKVVDFHGWALPVQFGGIIEEHLHTRSRAGLFDCSHMSEFLVQGREAIAALDALVFSDFVNLKIGRCRYSALMNDRAGIVDDCVGVRLDEETLYLVTNAGPVAAVEALFARYGVKAANISAATAKIDVQGPQSRDVLLALGLTDAAPLAYWNAQRTQWRGRAVLVARAGYTGELGYELYIDNDLAVDLWRALLEQPGAAPCGLGARDTLRLEVGYPLYGEDESEDKTPLECGMGRFIQWDKEFNGKAVLEAQRARDDYHRLTAIVSADRRSPRHGFEVKHGGETAGVVTSGTYGPSVGRGVGFASLAPAYARPGVALTAGPREMPVTTTEIPIYRDGTCRLKV